MWIWKSLKEMMTVIIVGQTKTCKAKLNKIMKNDEDLVMEVAKCVIDILKTCRRRNWTYRRVYVQYDKEENII